MNAPRVLLYAALLAAVAPAQSVQTVTLPSQSSLITFRIVFRTGSAWDPPGKEGAAALTAAMLSQGGSLAMPYDQIVRALFPLASSVRSQVDKEMTVFYGSTHADNLEKYYGLLRGMLLEPGWREEDFRRLKTDLINRLRVELRGNNDEELGKEALYLRIYEGHPYGHENTGTVAALEKLTLDDLKTFYRQNYTRNNVTIGLAGGYPQVFLEKITADFGRLPEGTPRKLELSQPKPARKLRIRILEKNTRAVAISLGFPISINRASPDWPALYVAQSYFGQHRSSKSYLYNRIREIRGLNYGDYAYIEYFPRGMFQFEPDPNLARQQQIFQIWIRPVEPQNALFALRAALFELGKLVRDGMKREDFEATCRYLTKFVNLLTQTDAMRLGYAIDSKYYTIPEFDTYVKNSLSKLRLEEVNEAIRKHWRATDLDVVIVAKDAAAMRKAILSGSPSTVAYVSPKPPEILAEDKVIGRYKLDATVDVLPADTVFER
jgi:zinc protease